MKIVRFSALALALTVASHAAAGDKSVAQICFEAGCGFINERGDVVVPPSPFIVFDLTQFTPQGNVLAAKDDEHNGLLSPQGKWVVAPKFSKLTILEDGKIVAYQKNNKAGFIDEAGKWLVPPKFDELDNMHFKGLYWAKQGKKAGIINAQGQWVVPAQFSMLASFSEGLAAAKKQGKWGFINPNGQAVIPVQFDDARDFSEGLAAVKKQGKWGFINPNGQWVVPPEFSYVDDFRDGYSVVQVNNRQGLISRDGWVIPPQFSEVQSPEKNGLVLVTQGKNSGFMNLHGEWVIPPNFESIFGSFSDDNGRSYNFSADGLTWAKSNGLWGMINTHGKWVITPQFKNKTSIKNAMSVEKNHQLGIIDGRGQWVLPLTTFTTEESPIVELDNGLIQLTLDKNGRGKIINEKGQTVLQFKDGCGVNEITRPDGQILWSQKVPCKKK